MKKHITITSNGMGRGLFGGGNVEYVTINSTGNAIDFGNLTVSRDSLNLLTEKQLQTRHLQRKTKLGKVLYK